VCRCLCVASHNYFCSCTTTGKISLEEFLAGGVEGLPAFDNIGNMGHHYDEESE
jgi:hypothetical protein